MYYRKFNNLISSHNLDKNVVKKIDSYLAHLSVCEAERINPVFISNTLDINYNEVLKILVLASEDENILACNYEAVCPNDGCVIKQLSKENFYGNQNYFDIECFRCDEVSHNISRNDIEITYSLNHPLHKSNYLKKILKTFKFISKKKVNEKSVKTKKGTKYSEIKEIKKELDLSPKEAVDFYQRERELDLKEKELSWINRHLTPKTLGLIFIMVVVLIAFCLVSNKKEFFLGFVDRYIMKRSPEQTSAPVIINNNNNFYADRPEVNKSPKNVKN